MFLAKLGEPAGLGGRAGARVGSAVAILLVAIFLAALALFFASRAQASSGERGARSLAGEITQAAQRLAGTPAASGGVADTGGTPAEPVVAARGLRAASAAPAVAVLRPSAHGAPAAALPDATAHIVAWARGMAATSGRPASATARRAASAAARAAANMLARKRHAEAIATGWPEPLAGEQPQTAVAVPALEELMAQFKSLAHAEALASAGTAPSLAHATVRQLALVSLLSVISAALPASARASQPHVGLGDGSAPAISAAATEVSAAASPEGLSEGAAKPAAARNEVKRTPTGASSALAVSPTFLRSPPPLAAGGATGQVPPAAALIVLAAACLLATRLLGRLAMDPLAWQSASLSFRLERPG